MINLIYRTCFYSINSELQSRQRPPNFSLKKCQQNLLNTINLSKCKLHVIADNFFGEVNLDLFRGIEAKITTIEAGTESRSFLAALAYALKLGVEPSSILYFLEDDYIHKDNWVDYLIDGFESDFDYISLYDHPDKYRRDFNQVALKVGKLTYWRKTTSTCNTFATRGRTLVEDAQVHYYFSRYPSQPNLASRDQRKFEVLSKYNARVIATPIPSIATHQNLPLPNFSNF